MTKSDSLLNQKRANLPAVTKQLEELAAAYEESKGMPDPEHIS